jgi:hypothetical protein
MRHHWRSASWSISSSCSWRAVESGGVGASLFSSMLGKCHNIFETTAGAALPSKCVAISTARYLD